ncbi:hypothetical protein LRS56_05065 [Pseudomonas poae]|nr:hypothetical protein LRS56_05065 [Pseudomonas poae]
MKGFKRVIGVSALLLLAGCDPNPVKTLTFNVPYGQLQTLLKRNVGEHGQLTCKFTNDQQQRGVKWAPSVILAAAKDQEEDDVLYLSSFTVENNGQRGFTLRTLIAGKRMLDTLVFDSTDQNGDYSLRLMWQADGAIGYQVAHGEVWSEKQVLEKPGFTVRHVAVHATGIKGSAVCELAE